MEGDDQGFRPPGRQPQPPRAGEPTPMRGPAGGPPRPGGPGRTPAPGQRPASPAGANRSASPGGPPPRGAAGRPAAPAAPAGAKASARPAASRAEPIDKPDPLGQSSAVNRSLAKFGQVALAGISAVVLVGTGIAWSASSGLTTSDALSDGPKSTGQSVNILLIGLDSRKDQNGQMLPKAILDQLHAGDGTEGGYNTNTLILMHVPGDGSKATAFSIPRDDAVDIPGEHKDKIKQAYGFAKDKAESKLRAQGITDQAALERQSRDAGRKATLQVVRNLTGVPIDHFAEVNLAGFYDLATALGGVDVCLNHAVNDDYSGAKFPAGKQSLDGSQALSFVRQRHGLTNGDLDRTHRQQAFLASIATKLRSSGTFTDTTKLSNLINVAKKDVVIDSGWDVLTFAQQAQGLSGGNMDFRTLPIEGFAKNGYGEDINVVDPAKVKQIVQQAFGLAPSSAPASSSGAPSSEAASNGITVEVDNASGTTGLAAKVSDGLAAHGYAKGTTRNASSRTKSTVAYGSGGRSDADKVAQLLGGLTVVSDRTLDAGHVRVTLGTQFSLPSSLQDTGSTGTAPQAASAPAGGLRDNPPPSSAAPSSTAPADNGPSGGTVNGGDIPCVD